MTSRHTAKNNDAIRVAAVVGCAVIAILVAMLALQICAVGIQGHGVVPAEVFFACASVTLIVAVAAAMVIDAVRKVLNARAYGAGASGRLPAHLSFLSAVTALILPPPLAGL